MEGHVLITDWSDISMEYSFCTHKPVLFINTPMKIMNPEYEKIDVVPINVEIRSIVGENVDVDQLDKVPEIINNLLGNREFYEKKIAEYAESQVYNIGNSAAVGGKYVVERLMEIKKEKAQAEQK